MDEALVCKLEAHALRAWPATISEPTADGWTLRATPGLDRGRSNHALTPCRPLRPAEITPALDRASAFAEGHGIRLGIQVSPAYLHGPLLDELDARGWGARWPTVVMARPAAQAPSAQSIASGASARSIASGASARSIASGASARSIASGAGARADALMLDGHASPEWLAAWARCELRDEADVAAHASTVFALLRGRAAFARLDHDAVAIGVPGDGLLGLFCIAVAPECRRAGLGTRITNELLARLGHATAYLQVEERNAGAIALYERLGFRETYRYHHRTR